MERGFGLDQTFGNLEISTMHSTSSVPSLFRTEKDENDSSKGAGSESTTEEAH